MGFSGYSFVVATLAIEALFIVNYVRALRSSFAAHQEKNAASLTAARCRARRCLISAALTLIAGMIGLWFAAPGIFRRHPLFTACYWLVVLILAIWVIVLGVFDWRDVVRSFSIDTRKR